MSGDRGGAEYGKSGSRNKALPDDTCRDRSSDFIIADRGTPALTVG